MDMETFVAHEIGGYSIMTPFETETQKEQMKHFLSQHGQTLTDITRHAKTTGASNKPFAVYDQLDFTGDVTDPLLGYNYGNGTTREEQDYYFTLCHWMAVHGGKKQSDGRPYVVCDGYEHWTLFVKEKRPPNFKGDGILVNPFGYRPISSISRHQYAPKLVQLIWHASTARYRKIDDAIYQEMKRLSQLWHEQQTTD